MKTIKNRAMTAKQKQEVIGKIFEHWMEYPELRLGQLIDNALFWNNANDNPNGMDINLFSIEDYDFIKLLENFKSKYPPK